MGGDSRVGGESLEALRKLSEPRPGKGTPGTDVALGESDEEEGQTAAFGFLRGIRDRALNIEFRRSAEGDAVSFPYSWLGPTRHHPSIGIQLLFAGSELYLVMLRGRNLNAVVSGVSLYDRGILRHRVTWVRVSSSVESRTLPESACVVEQIELRVISSEDAAKVLGYS
jgi:hypothetical protein